MDVLKTESPGTLPQSTSNYWVNLFCLFFFFIPMVFLHNKFPQIGVIQLTSICLAATVIPLWIHDLFYVQIHRRLSTGLLSLPTKTDQQRLVVKLIGLYGTFLIILSFYYLSPVYRLSQRAATFYSPFFYVLQWMMPWIILFSFIYFWQIDRRQKDPYDGYWHMGCLLTGRLKQINVVILKEYARVWFIKGFFTPFMFAALIAYIDGLLSFSRHLKDLSFLSAYDHLLDLFYAIDIIYGVLGYILTVRLLDTHIQSTEPTFLGWIVCLACYSPFSDIFGIGFFSCDDGWNWNHWFAFCPGLYYFWGAVIIFLTLVYGLATVAFGYRMSNLTYRGIITSGPYRFTKHPAYVCKVATWWMISLPFLTIDNALTAVHYSFNLGVITFIYYLRAKTEENHLSNYPEYVQYANWINKHGIFSFITRHFPALQYSEERAKKWRSVVWFKKI